MPLQKMLLIAQNASSEQAKRFFEKQELQIGEEVLTADQLKDTTDEVETNGPGTGSWKGRGL